MVLKFKTLHFAQYCCNVGIVTKQNAFCSVGLYRDNVVRCGTVQYILIPHSYLGDETYQSCFLTVLLVCLMSKVYSVYCCSEAELGCVKYS
jgi:hypothetical protein